VNIPTFNIVLAKAVPTCRIPYSQCKIPPLHVAKSCAIPTHEMSPGEYRKILYNMHNFDHYYCSQRGLWYDRHELIRMPVFILVKWGQTLNVH